MTVPLMRIWGLFAVARPIPWDAQDTLRDHIDRVVDALKEAHGVVEVETEAELEEGEVRIEIVIAGIDEAHADRVGRETIGASIRGCDARHSQLLPPDEEAAFIHNLPSRSGLLTPLWRLRRLMVEPVVGA